MLKTSKLISIRNKKRKMLLVQRKKDPPGVHSFPGGKRKRSESARKAVRRELKQELPEAKCRVGKIFSKSNGTSRKKGVRVEAKDTFFFGKVTGKLTRGKEIRSAAYMVPWHIRFTRSARAQRDKLHASGYLKR